MTKSKTTKAAIYLRVSTDKQTTENQLRELERVAEFSGWEIVEVYTDHGISGAKGKDQRPAFKKLCNDATSRKFDMIMAWSVDRLGRSMKDLVEFMEELKALKVDLYLKQQNIDSTTPAGKAMFQMVGVFAEFERAMIVERVNAGLARAKAEGKTLGRPKLNDEVVSKVLEDRNQGMSLRAIQGKHGVSLGAVHKIVKGKPLAVNVV
ncbi:MAG: recombinase family protein [Alphaproteobacteria bacterium]